MRWLVGALVVVVVVGALAMPARACAVCGAAERALPERGTEVPFEGRKRVSLDARAAAFETTDAQRIGVSELRAEVGAAVAVAPRIMLGVEVPLLRRTIGEAERVMLGDVEVRATQVAWRDASGRRLTLGGGTKAPTAPLEYGPDGATLAPDLQAGCGAVAPFVSATGAWMGSLVSAWTTGTFVFPVAVRDGPHPGDSLRASATMQLQPLAVLATRIGVNARYDTLAESEGEVVRRSGGAAVHVSTELVLSPVHDVVVGIGAAFPVVQEMRAYRGTSPIAMLSIGVDL